MRRLVGTVALACCAAVFAAGCGGDGSSGGALEATLAYLPKDTPFAVAIETDPEGDQHRSLGELLARFPGGGSVTDGLKRQLEEGDDGVSFEEDIKPLLGNPFVVSATDVTAFVDDSEDDDFVAALQAEDGEALDRLVEKTKAEEQGEVAGAILYEDEGTFFAVEEQVIVFGGSRELLEAALERADGGDHLTVDVFEHSLDGLPEEALARMHLDVQALIERDPDAQEAGKVEWVAALTTLGMTFSVEDDAVDVEFNLRSEGEGLSDEDLPLAAGGEAPEVANRPGEVGFGIRDPRQIVAFFEGALQAVDPQAFGEYDTGKRAIAQRYDIDLDKDLFDQLGGDLSVSVAVDGSFAARAAVEDAGAFAATADKLARALPELGSALDVREVTRRGDLYEARQAGGGSFVFGVSEGVFVVASDRGRALELAANEPSAVPGVEGSFAMTADAERVALELVEQLPLGERFAAGLAVRPLDELTGSMSSSTESVRGKLRVTVD